MDNGARRHPGRVALGVIFLLLACFSVALLFSNSDRIERVLLTNGKDRLLGRLAELKTEEEIVECAVRNIFSRPPTTEEKRVMSEYLASRRARMAEAQRQMVWALLTSAEFRFNY